MAHENLVCIPLLPIVDGIVVVLGVLDEAMGDVVPHGSWIRLRISGREGHQLVGCPYFLQSAQGGWMRGGRRAMGSFFFHLSPAVAVALVRGGEGVSYGVGIGICIGTPLV
jgi:hypothetical protein